MRLPLKRCLDLVFAALGLLAAGPLLAAVAVAIRINMNSPIFFRQRRPGLHGDLFEMIKFRTMSVPPPGVDAVKTDSARLTKLGRFLRSTSIDELPTLYNVVRGDMSMVGPRPLLERYLRRYTPHQARRHEVHPGISGWAQVSGRNALSWEEKFELDIWYVDNRSLVLDLKIVALTVLSVVRCEGVGHGDDELMPEFMGSEADA